MLSSLYYCHRCDYIYRKSIRLIPCSIFCFHFIFDKRQNFILRYLVKRDDYFCLKLIFFHSSVINIKSVISWWNYNEINEIPNCNQTLFANNVFMHENLGSIVIKNNDNTRIKIFQMCKIRSNFFAKYCEVNLFHKNIEISI